MRTLTVFPTTYNDLRYLLIHNLYNMKGKRLQNELTIQFGDQLTKLMLIVNHLN